MVFLERLYTPESYGMTREITPFEWLISHMKWELMCEDSRIFNTPYWEKKPEPTLTEGQRIKLSHLYKDKEFVAFINSVLTSDKSDEVKAATELVIEYIKEK